MSWFNYIGLIFVVVIMVPNVIYAIKHKDVKGERYKNKIIEICEQVSRYGCLAFMIFNIPYLYFNFWLDIGIVVYIVLGSLLSVAYCACWGIFGKEKSRAKALTLSMLPPTLFLISGVLLLNIPLIVFSIMFAVCHVIISLDIHVDKKVEVKEDIAQQNEIKESDTQVDKMVDTQNQ